MYWNFFDFSFDQIQHMSDEIVWILNILRQPYVERWCMTFELKDTLISFIP